MATTDAQLAEVAAWLNQYVAARRLLEDNLKAQSSASWAAFGGWYDTQAVGQLAADLAGLSGRAQGLIAGSAQRYVAATTAVVRGTAVATPPTQMPPLRNGADPLRVHTRPAEVFRLTYAKTEDEQAALAAAVRRAEQLAETDVQLAGRSAQQAQLRALGVTHYRRILRPELAKHGSCGLCVVASDRIYSVEHLLPIHGGCNCETAGIEGDHDPGRSLNDEDLQRLYAAAGSTSGDDLKRIRVTVHDHGELGPVLGRHGDHFRGAKDVPLDRDPARAKRMLDQISPVLAHLEQRAAAGHDLTGPLTYQRDLAARLSRIVDAAA